MSVVSLLFLAFVSHVDILGTSSSGRGADINLIHYLLETLQYAAHGEGGGDTSPAALIVLHQCLRALLMVFVCAANDSSSDHSVGMLHSHTSFSF